MLEFDDSRLDCPEALDAADSALRHIASAGARVRLEVEVNECALASLEIERPRAILAIGPEARLLRAVLEPYSPVPFIAWPAATVPAWVGPLDVVVALAACDADEATLTAVSEVNRRGSRLLVVAPERSAIAVLAASHASTVLVSKSGDEHVAAILALAALHRMGLGPLVSTEAVADALDAVACDCAPRRNLAENKAKELACGLAEAQPLVWGSSVLAARASRRIAEALREATGRVALAGEAEDLLPIIKRAHERDPFADPDEADLRPVLLILEDGSTERARERVALVAAADRHDVRVCLMRAGEGGPVEQYASLLAQGLYVAAYLHLALVAAH